jgi:hypothetical protein
MRQLDNRDGRWQTWQLVEGLHKVIDTIQNSFRIGPKLGFEELIIIVLDNQSVKAVKYTINSTQCQPLNVFLL